MPTPISPSPCPVPDSRRPLSYSFNKYSLSTPHMPGVRLMPALLPYPQTLVLLPDSSGASPQMRFQFCLLRAQVCPGSQVNCTV